MGAIQRMDNLLITRYSGMASRALIEGTVCCRNDIMETFKTMPIVSTAVRSFGCGETKTFTNYAGWGESLRLLIREKYRKFIPLPRLTCSVGSACCRPKPDRGTQTRRHRSSGRCAPGA